MTLEFGNRLAAMRKEKGYSQEELAEKLGVSRQAVSKWERGEASPDTDNLIALAALYEITLDELIQGKVCAGAKQKESVHIGFDGIHVENEKESVHVSLQGGVHVHDAHGTKVHVDGNGVHVEDGSGHIYQHHPGTRWKWFLDATVPLLTAAAYLLLGFVCNAWHPGWLVFFAIPIISSLAEAIVQRNPNCFAWPVLVTFVYLWGGFIHHLWHPLWIVYFTVPAYYLLIKAFRKTPEEEGERPA